MSTRGGGDLPKATQIAFIRNYLRQANLEAAGATDIDRVTAQIDLEAEVDSSLSVSENWEAIKEKFGLVTAGEFDDLTQAYEEAENDRVRREIRDQFDEYGIEAVANVLVGNPAPAELEQRVNDVLEEYPPDVYDTIIREEVGNLFDLLGQDFRIVETERLEELRQEAARVGDIAEARDQVLEAFRGSFGQEFENVQDTIRSLQERIARARGERLRIAPIQARRSGDTVLVRIEDGDDFDDFEDLARRRVRRAIGFAPDEPQVWTDVGEIRVRGGELEAISIEEGVERFGTTEEAEDVPILEEFETEQERLVEPEAQPGDDLARRAIELLRRA